jgi:hypothetical protein
MSPRLSTQSTELISFQRGILARWQVSDCAADMAAIDLLLRNGRWQTLYRGVYAAHTGEPPREGILWAAVRRCGPAAALSHFTAAELDGLVSRRSDAVHVTIPPHLRVRLSDREFTRGLPRIVVHRSARLTAAMHPARIPPRTRIEETVLDLAEMAENLEAVFSCVSGACNGRLLTPAQIRVAVTRRAKMRWRSDILLALEEISDGVSSTLEVGYLRKVERPHGLPKAERQVRKKRGETSAYLDNLYEEFGVGVELDGLAAHPAEARWQDIHRDNYFARSGIITLRYNWADVTLRPCHVAAEISQVLRQRGWPGPARRCGPSCRAQFS